MQPGPSWSSRFFEDKRFLSVHQIIKTPQEFVHYSSWLERAFWWGKHTTIFQKTFSSIKLLSPITQKSRWFQENVMMRPFPLTFVADSSVATGSTSSKIKCCDQSFVVKCVATLLFYCLSLLNNTHFQARHYVIMISCSRFLQQLSGVLLMCKSPAAVSSDPHSTAQSGNGTRLRPGSAPLEVLV